MSDPGHFSAEEWADFVRHTAPVDSGLAMQHHLQNGCQKCTEARDTWQHVATSAESDARHEPPDSTVRIARALFALREAPSGVAGVIGRARALFDSGLMPLPAGVRSGLAAPRKLVYAAGEYLVDLQVSGATRRPDGTQVTGQVAMPANALQLFEGIPVIVLRHARILAKTTTNRFGEFHIEFEGQADDVSLALGFEGGGTVIALAHATRMQS
jgi:hypothetical protein